MRGTTARRAAAALLLALPWATGCGGSSGGGPEGASAGLVVELRRADAAPPSSLVSVFFSVRSAAGEPVAGLTESAFEISEDGQPDSVFESTKQISSREQTFRTHTVLLLDLSDSIVRSGALPTLKSAAKQMVEAVLAQDQEDVHQIAIYWFDGSREIHNALGGGGFTGDLDQLKAAIDGLSGSQDRSTNLYGATVQGLEVLDKERDAQPPEMITAGVLVLFTDGTDNAGRVSESAAMFQISITPHTCYTIGLGGEIRERVLRSIGKDGFEPAADQSKLEESFGRIADFIRNLANSFYLLEYCSPKRAGTHQLTVTARQGEAWGSVATSFDATGFTPTCSLSDLATSSVVFGGPGDDSGGDVELAADRSRLLGAEFHAEVPFGAWTLRSRGGQDVLLARVDRSGTPVWARSLGSDGEETVAEIAGLEAGGSLVAGGSCEGDLEVDGGSPSTARGGRDGYVVAYEDDGTHRFHVRVGGSGSDEVSSVAATGTQVLIGGHFTGALTLGGETISSAGGRDAFVAALRPVDGTAIWLRRIGGSGEDELSDVTPLAAGTVAVSMRLARDGTLAGGGAEDAAATAGGRIAIYEGTSGDLVGSVGTKDVLGADLRSGRLVEAGDGVIYGCGSRADVSAGGAATSASIFALSDTLERRWHRSFGGGVNERLNDLAWASDGSLVIVGSFEGTIDLLGPTYTSRGSRDLFVLSVSDETGAHLRSASYGDALEDDARGVAVDAAGDTDRETVVTGRFAGVVGFDDSQRSSEGASGDIFILSIR